MKITLESTSRIVQVNGVPARVWQGTTASGVRVVCLVTRIAVETGQDTSLFERELEEHAAPRSDAVEAFPLRLIL